MISASLKEAAGDFVDHSANDFFLPASDENRAIVTAVLHHHDQNHPNDKRTVSDEELIDAGAEVFIYDYWALDYFAERCLALAKHPESAVALTSAELFAISELLTYAYEDRERASEDICFDLTYLATAENKAIIAATAEIFAAELEKYTEPYRHQVAETLGNVRRQLAQGDEIDVPDFWLMYYLADRCGKISGMADCAI